MTEHDLERDLEKRQRLAQLDSNQMCSQDGATTRSWKFTIDTGRSRAHFHCHVSFADDGRPIRIAIDGYKDEAYVQRGPVSMICELVSEALRLRTTTLEQVFARWVGESFWPGGTCEQTRGLLRDGDVCSPLDAVAIVVGSDLYPR